MRVRIWLIAVSCCSFALAQACGDDTVVPTDASTDATTSNDTGPIPGHDGGGNDTGPTTDAGPGDTGPSDTGTTDSAPSTLVYQCDVDGGTVTSCAQCAGFPFECVLCETADASVLYGHCVTQGTSCSANAPTNFGLCPCGTDAGNCPEGYQVCRNQVCRTCGEAQNTNNLACKGGGACNAADGGCL